ncbi:MAG: hypothetical protein LUI13_03830 [Lachnospiraceae bacterium]|nr:hypothetical protein [Lachnospiraceae bacterium]
MSTNTKSFARSHKHPSVKKSNVKKRKDKKSNSVAVQTKGGTDTVSQIEDGVMKVMMEFFSELADLRAKISSGEPVTRGDLATLPLLPLFGGKSSQQKRFRAAFEITVKADNVSRPDIEKIEAAVYAMATKFLTNTELLQIKGEIKMTYLGQLLVEDGRAEGREEGRAEERENTERERQRAEKAEANARKAEAELQKLKKQFGLA